MERYESYLKKLKSGHFKRCIRVDWLNADESIAWSIDDKLYDISPVFLPAYEETSCSKRFAEIELTSKEIDNKMNLLQAEIDIL